MNHGTHTIVFEKLDVIVHIHSRGQRRCKEVSGVRAPAISSRAVRSVAANLLAAQHIVEVHFSREVAEACDAEEAPVRRKRNGVSVRCPESKRGSSRDVVQRCVARHSTSTHHETV